MLGCGLTRDWPRHADRWRMDGTLVVRTLPDPSQERQGPLHTKRPRAEKMGTASRGGRTKGSFARADNWRRGREAKWWVGGSATTNGSLMTISRLSSRSTNAELA